MRLLDIWYAQTTADDIETELMASGSQVGLDGWREGRSSATERDLLEGPLQGPAQGDGLADRGRRRAVAHRRRSADRLPHQHPRRGGLAVEDVQRLPWHAGREPPGARGALSIRRCGPEGRGRRKRRDALLRRAARRSRPGRPAPAPGQGGDGIRAGSLRHLEPAHEPRRTRRGRPAPDAGHAGHLPRLDTRPRRA